MQSVCNGTIECANGVWSQWTQNTDLWGMLRSAQAGDILFIGVQDDFFAWGEFYRFDGSGQDILSGISRSSLHGGLRNSHSSTMLDDDYISYLNNLTIADLFRGYTLTDRGEKKVEWGGYITWGTLSDGAVTYSYPNINSYHATEYSNNTWISRIYQWVAGAIPVIGPVLSSEGSDWLGIGSRTMNVDYGNHHFTFELNNDGFIASWELLHGVYTYYPDQYDCLPPNFYLLYGFYPE